MHNVQGPIKAGQAALIVTYGNTTHKQRPLDRDLIILGRSQVCDITLVSPEVAPIHCVIQRAGHVWRVRDCCGGRHTTRINGRPVQEEMLHDNDVLQVGTFTFEVRLPVSRITPVAGCTTIGSEEWTRRIKRLQRSRRKLVRLALKYRSRARKRPALPPTLAELERQAECLRTLQCEYARLVREYELRVDELERAEREVCDDREALDRECTERQMQLDNAEAEMACRQAEMELRWQECQRRCRQAEQAHALPARDAALADTASEERAVLLDRRSRELHSFARHLRRCQQRLRDQMRQPCRALADEQAVEAEALGTAPAECRPFPEDFTASEDRHESQDTNVKTGEGCVSARLSSQLRRLKHDLASSSSPSAHGDQLRS
jgi:hypothetical protein